MNDLIPCAGSVTAFLIVFGFLAYLRYLRHKEILALAEKGLPYPKSRNGKKDTLRWGVIITAVGLALLAG
jgi:phosphate/sulfate permease